MDKAFANSDAGKTILVIAACYDASAERRWAEQQTEFDLMMTVDCGLEFGPL
jgi:hypothetical protein